MVIRYGDRGMVYVDNVDGRDIKKRNFSGEADRMDAGFILVIRDREIVDELMDRGWEVRIRGSEEDPMEEPFMFLPIKVKFNRRPDGSVWGPSVYIQSGKAKQKLSQETMYRLDSTRENRGIDISHADLDFRPHEYVRDDGSRGQTAYLSSMWVWQALDRFEERFLEEDDDE